MQVQTNTVVRNATGNRPIRWACFDDFVTVEPHHDLFPLVERGLSSRSVD